MSISFACIRLRIVRLTSKNFPALDLPQMCVKPRKVKVLARSRSTLLLRLAVRPKRTSRVFSGCSSRANLRIRSRKFALELLGFPFVLESEQHVVRISHDDNVAAGFAGAPLLDP